MNGSAKNQWLDSWHIEPSSTKSFDFLDGIRGVAILMVVVCHVLFFDPDTSGGARFVFGIFEAGALGVTIFFALSGFLISLAFWKKKADGTSVDLRRYAVRRFWKIAPPLLMTVILFTPIYIHLYGDASTYFTAALKWLTGFSFVAPVSGKFNKVMWSLIVEVHFYITLPLAFLAFRRIGYLTTLIFLSGLYFLLPMAAHVIYSLNGLKFSLLPDINVRFPSVLYAFSSGILVAGLHQADLIPKKFVRFASWGLAGILIAYSCAGICSVIFGHVDYNLGRSFNGSSNHLDWLNTHFYKESAGCFKMAT